MGANTLPVCQPPKATTAQARRNESVSETVCVPDSRSTSVAARATADFVVTFTSNSTHVATVLCALSGSVAIGAPATLVVVWLSRRTTTARAEYVDAPVACELIVNTSCTIVSMPAPTWLCAQAAAAAEIAAVTLVGAAGGAAAFGPCVSAVLATMKTSPTTINTTGTSHGTICQASERRFGMLRRT